MGGGQPGDLGVSVEGDQTLGRGNFQGGDPLLEGPLSGFSASPAADLGPPGTCVGRQDFCGPGDRTGRLKT